MYSIGEVLYTNNSLYNKTFFYIISDKFVNYFGDTVYELQTVIDDKYGPSKITEISKYMDWLHRADDLTLY